MSLPRLPRTMAMTALAWPVLVLLALPGAAPPACAQGPGGATPEFVALEPAVPTSEDLHWEVRFTLRNPLPTGLYMDSLWCDVEDLDPGQTRTPRVTRMDMQQLLGLVADLSPGEGTAFQFESPSTVEQGRLTFHLLAHDAAHKRYPLETRVEVTPGPTTERYPSRFLTVDGRKVEIVLVPALRDSAPRPAPGILLVHDHGENARKLLRTALLLARRGYAVMLVSMPGYGLSEGAPDYMGPATLRAAQAALDELARTPGVDPKRLGVWGAARGANVAMTLAVRRGDVAAVVAQSGVYDLWAAWRGGASARLRGMVAAEAGRDSSAWRERSPALQSPGPLEAAVLFLHGEKEPEAPVAQARSFFEALRAAGKHAEAKFFPGGERALPRNEILSLTLAFFARQLHP